MTNSLDRGMLIYLLPQTNMRPSTMTETFNQPQKKVGRMSHAERVELSEGRMLDATAALILTLGTQKTTLKEVGEKAGYSRGLAHARFGSKENLFSQLSDRCRRNWLRELQIAEADKQGLAALLSRIDAAVSYGLRHPNDARVMYILWFESVGLDSNIKANLARFHQQAREDAQNLVTQALDAGEIAKEINTEVFAMHFTSTMFGVSYQWVVGADTVDIEAALKGIKEQMLLILRPTARGKKRLREYCGMKQASDSPTPITPTDNTVNREEP